MISLFIQKYIKYLSWHKSGGNHPAIVEDSKIITKRILGIFEEKKKTQKNHIIYSKFLYAV